MHSGQLLQPNNARKLDPRISRKIIAGKLKVEGLRQQMPCQNPKPSASLVALRFGEELNFAGRAHLRLPTSNMIEIAKMGRVRTQMPDAQTRRAATQVRQNAAAKAWAESSPVSTISEADYVKKIQPLLPTVSNSAIASALGISLPYAADIRRSKRRPNQRHWQALAELVESLGN